MFADYVKMGVKVAALAAAILVVVSILGSIQVPAVDYSVIQDFMGKALAIANHYIFGFNIIWPATKMMITLLLSLYTARFGLMAYYFVMKVNE